MLIQRSPTYCYIKIYLSDHADCDCNSVEHNRIWIFISLALISQLNKSINDTSTMYSACLSFLPAFVAFSHLVQKAIHDISTTIFVFVSFLLEM